MIVACSDITYNTARYSLTAHTLLRRLPRNLPSEHTLDHTHCAGAALLARLAFPPVLLPNDKNYQRRSIRGVYANSAHPLKD